MKAGGTWLLRCLLLAGLSAILASPALAVEGGKGGAAGGTRSPPARPSPVAKIQDDPLLFYLAKAEPGACGEGCSEWIAVEGSFDKGAADRLRGFLRQQKNPKLPIYFNSPGGYESEGLKIGRLLRERGMTAGVARTVPAACISVSDEACRAVKRSAQAVAARWVSFNATCNSSCVYALIGAKVREVPAGARIGVHSSKLVEMTYNGRAIDLSSDRLPSAVKARIATLQTVPRSYVREMGIDAGLNEVISRTPYERIQVLSRAEIAKFGIDKRTRHETGWMVVASRASAPTIVKVVTSTDEGRANAPDVALMRLRCFQNDRIGAEFYHRMSPDEHDKVAAAKFSVAGRSTAFLSAGSVISGEALDPGASLFRYVTATAPRFFDEAATQATFDIIESVTVRGAAAGRTVTFSTAGLSDALKHLRDACGKGRGNNPPPLNDPAAKDPVSSDPLTPTIL